MVLKDMLRHWVNPRQADWDDLLDCAEFATSSGFNQSVKDTPFQLNYV